MEQLIILGNGFDLASCLKSKYYDFYDSRYKDSLTCRIDSYMTWIEDNNNINEYPEKESLKDITIWDIIFHRFEQVKDKPWTDVEKTIHKYLENIYFACIHKEKTNPYNIRTEDPDYKNEFVRYKAIVRLLSWKLGLDEDNYSCVDTGWTWSMEEQKKSRWDVFKGQILKDLYCFEMSFANYLRGATNRKGYKQFANGLLKTIIQRYDENGKNCSMPLKGLKTSVLSFNYTGLDEFDKSNTIPIVNYRNVHGKLSGKERTIFGIDLDNLKQSESISGINNSSLFLDFTKTFRTLKLASSYGVEKLFSKNVDRIKFYGHGLGEADYSYFMSIFDAIDLYSNETMLIFFYNKNLKDEGEEEKQFKNVSNLILKYASTLNNKDHSDNLLHKLILENRIKILPI